VDTARGVDATPFEKIIYTLILTKTLCCPATHRCRNNTITTKNSAVYDEVSPAIYNSTTIIHPSMNAGGETVNICSNDCVHDYKVKQHVAEQATCCWMKIMNCRTEEEHLWMSVQAHESTGGDEHRQQQAAITI
jgi:hypothetical protein